MALPGEKDVEKGLLRPEYAREPKPVAAADARRIMGLPVHVVSGAAYCVASASMVLLNKAALSSFDFNSTTSLLFFQCLVCVILVKTADLLGFVTLEPWNMKIIQAWFPVNLIFVGMIWTSFFALKNLGVPMATVLKNLTNLFVIGGDYFFYNKTYGSAVWLTLGLMMLSAVCGAATDLAFNLTGYFWQLINCMFTAAYSLYLRGVMDRLVGLTVNKTRLDEFSMVFYNNLLSLPLLLILIWQGGEFDSLAQEPALQNPYFLTAALASSLLAFCISFASLWFLSSTTATTYSLVGSLNKIPVALIGLVAFNVPWSPQNLLSILVGLGAGVIFVRAKQAPPK
ncbi:hypothetical protein ABBQ38_004222 [Trebouxia sp. C0009 RCD-2024]